MGRNAKLKAKRRQSKSKGFSPANQLLLNRRAVPLVEMADINWAFVSDGGHTQLHHAVAEVLHHMVHETICSDEVGFILDSGVCLSTVWHREKLDASGYHAQVYTYDDRWRASLSVRQPSDADVSVVSLVEIVAVKVNASHPIDISAVQDMDDFAGLSYRILPVIWTACPSRVTPSGIQVSAAQVHESVAIRFLELSQARDAGNPVLALSVAIKEWMDSVYSLAMETETRELMHRPPLAKHFARLNGQLLSAYEAA